jgi:8-oxo-dGTP pyrophosphatase MutT (NUDIX family)
MTTAHGAGGGALPDTSSQKREIPNPHTISQQLSQSANLGGSNHADVSPAHNSAHNSSVAAHSSSNTSTTSAKAPGKTFAKRVDETSAGGLVIDKSGTRGLLIGRFDIKDKSREKILWSLPKGHIEEGETPEIAAIREVAEETGIQSEIKKSLGVIDFWFMAGGKRIHKTVHHFLFSEVGGELMAQESEVDRVDWFPLDKIIDFLAYSDEKKLIARSGKLEL